jgi:hypothetical protein
MSKARTLADFISDGSEFADGTISVAEVSGAAPLASPTFTGNVDLGDNVQIRLGDDNDLRLYHDGAASYVMDTGTGNLQLRGDNSVALRSYSTTDNYLVANFNGSVDIYYDNSKKLATKTDGVTITGDVGATTATITGKTTTDELDLNALAATISDTAVDIFVYDTRKDSDGGAWRRRTQHTSWYNEAASSTRGSRKEFPAVAVIVSTTSYVTIYDGDDPDLPMWAKYSLLNHDEIKVAAFNGVLILGNKYTANSGYGGNGLVEYNYVADVTRHGMQNGSQPSYDPVTSGIKSGDFSTNIGQNSDSQDRYYTLVNYNINDVAMTVLPNAPIDSATGLPVPTIAVATNGGYSIIKDDGTVVDGTCSQSLHNRVQKVKFTKDNRLAYLGFDYNLQTRSRVWRVDDIISADTVITTSAVEAQNSAEFYGNANGIVSQDELLKILVNPSDYAHAGYVEANENTFIAGNNDGVSLVDRNKTKPSDGMVSFVASDYQTGYQVGDIKLATLSDTDDTDVTGSELVTNGTFDSDITGWTARNSDATLSFQSGQLRVENANAALGEAYQSISLTAGVTYTFSANITAINTSHGQFFLGTGTTGTSSTVAGAQYNTTGVKSFTYTPTSSGTYYIILGHRGANVAGYYAQYDNISVRLAESDRSVNGNGLQVFGTVTKNPVATGADLVAYSGFSTSNYLAQPYNSDIDVGTGDFSIAIWAKANAFNTFNALFAHWRASVTDSTQFSLETVGSKMYFYVVDSGNYSFAGGNTTLSTGLWYQFIVTRRSGLITLYINGVPESTTDAYAGDLTARTDPLTIGALWSSTGPSGGVSGAWNGSLALARFSATAPSPEQIKKIYEDEKVLFQENAQATLYGSSDAVTALAYDDSTELLHVGTSAGRSVFQGLRRVDNTTTAVGAAISASNGLVADE